MNYRKNHQEGCNCKICNNEIREERQYAAMPIKGDQYITLDAKEYWHFDEFMENRSEKGRQPEYPKIYPDENKKPVLAYGVLIPQQGCEIKNWEEELVKYKEYGFGTLDDKRILISAYEEFELYPEEMVYNRHIPCALLLDTELDLTKERDYGFGHTAFLLYSNMEIFDNIFNRDFLFCLGGCEERCEPDRENWRKFIDKKKLIQIAERLF